MRVRPASFSALQRAENSSITAPLVRPHPHRARFSALQRAENSSIENRCAECANTTQGFSALQRAENSSIPVGTRATTRALKFQCSSASRKFLNHRDSAPVLTERHRFSALQRAENSSIIAVALQYQRHVIVSVLFSEPKIPQLLNVSGIIDTIR